MDPLSNDHNFVISFRNVGIGNSDSSAQIVVLYKFNIGLKVAHPDGHSFLDRFSVITGQNDLHDTVLNCTGSIDRRLQIINICPDELLPALWTDWTSDICMIP